MWPTIHLLLISSAFFMISSLAFKVDKLTKKVDKLEAKKLDSSEYGN